MFCQNCGAPLNGNYSFCPHCGAMIAPAPPPGATPFPSQPPASGKLNVLHFVWSIILIVIGASGAILPLIFGIISLISVNQARSAPTQEEEQKKIRLAMILNIIATACIALVVLFCIFWMILIITFGTL